MPRYLDLDEAKQNPDWQVVFAGGVNAGDAAPILWESPFESAFGLWQIKTKRKPRPEQTPAMLHGINTEPLIFAWYKEHKRIDGRSQVWAIHDECEFIRGLGDFWNAELRHGAEFKSPSRDDSSDHILAKQGQVPFHYLLQCWHLMEVYDAATWDFVSWRSESDFALVPVERNSEYWLTVMLPAELEFWRRVTEDEWPRPEGSATDEGEEWRTNARRLLDARAMLTEAENIKKRAEAVLKRLATAKITAGGGVRATWTEYKARHEAVISAASPEALERIMKALAPLEGKQGVSKIKSRFYPANLILKVAEDGE